MRCRTPEPHPTPDPPLPLQILSEKYPGMVQAPTEVGFETMLQFNVDAVEGDKEEFATKATHTHAQTLRGVTPTPSTEALLIFIPPRRGVVAGLVI